MSPPAAHLRRRGERPTLLTVRLGGVLAALAALAVLALAKPAAAKSFDIDELHTAAVVNPDGSMDVHERVTYDFSGGTFTVGIRSFDPSYRSLIVDLTATEQGEELAVIPPSDSISGEWEWMFASAAFDERRTFDLTYRVHDAVAVGPDMGELYWKFIGDDHPGIGTMTVDIALPGGFPAATPATADDDASVVRAWAHGPSNGTVTVRGDTVGLAVTGVPAETFVEARVLVPAGAFTAPPAGPARLPTVLAEERAYQDEQDREQLLRSIALWSAPIVAGLGIAAFVVMWWIWGKEPSPPESVGEYWREPHEDPPAVVTSTLAFGHVDGTAFAATVIDLAQRGWLTIEEHVEERFGPDRTVYTFRWTGRGKDPLQPYERTLLQQLFQGRTQTTSEEFAAWARTNPGTAQTFWSQWKASVSDDVKTRGYLETGRIAPWLALVTLEAVLGLTGLLSLMAGAWTFFIPWVVAIGLLFASGTLRRRTPKGAEQAAEAEALKRFLRDFSSLDGTPVAGLAIWERFLVYAVALGVAADLVRGLAVKVPEVAQNAAFASWYVGAAGRSGLHGLESVGGFTHTFGSTATSSLTPSSSGSSGGFSGGGGGGGGGGGFGAR